MTQTQNADFRVLARDVAQELDTDELAQVSGGEDTTASCKQIVTIVNDLETSCTFQTK
jgi:bacteriocin-like protein